MSETSAPSFKEKHTVCYVPVSVSWLRSGLDMRFLAGKARKKYAASPKFAPDFPDSLRVRKNSLMESFRVVPNFQSSILPGTSDSRVTLRLVVAAVACLHARADDQCPSHVWVKSTEVFIRSWLHCLITP